jgi:predicted GNAT family acetyltransferase
MRIQRFRSAAAFLAAAEPDLAHAEVENNLILGNAYDVARRAHPDSVEPYFAAAFDNGRVLMAAFRTLAGKVGVTRTFRPEAFRPLAEDVIDACPETSAVIGPAPDVDAFAAVVADMVGRPARLHSRQRIHQLAEVRLTEAPAPGRLRLARPEDADILTLWTDGFFAAIREPGESRTLVRSRLADEALYLWECDGGPVSMAAWTGRTRRTVRVAHVYTPPEHRGQGYATALVAALSRRLLADGVDRCCLYTDVANPTSNAIYRRIGYEPIADVCRFEFEA